MRKLLFNLSARLRCRLITIHSRPYLERYYVGKVFGWTFYLHRFVSADKERHLHNHPWKRGVAIVLAGSYQEDRVYDLCEKIDGSGCLVESRRVRWWNSIDGNDFHQISDADPETWTLFIHGERQRLKDGSEKGWGFLRRIFLDTGNGPKPVVTFEAYDSTSTRGWHDTAPTGAEIDRQPFQVSA